MKKIIDILASRMSSLIGLDFDVVLQDDLFSKINQKIYLGSRPKPEHIETLKNEGITHIVSCLDMEKYSNVVFLDKDFQTLFLPVKDNISEDITSTFTRFFDFISTSQNSSTKAKFLVHCEVGVSRSATLVIAFLMHHEHKNFINTFNYVRSKRAKILPNIGFASQLQKLEHTYSQTNHAKDNPSSLAQYLNQICNVPVEIELLQTMLDKHNYNALPAIQTLFGGDIPRVIQGIRL